MWEYKGCNNTEQAGRGLHMNSLAGLFRYHYTNIGLVIKRQRLGHAAWSLVFALLTVAPCVPTRVRALPAGYTKYTIKRRYRIVVLLFCAPGRARTCDRLLKRELLYQLSYRGITQSIILNITKKSRLSQPDFSTIAHQSKRPPITRSIHRYADILVTTYSRLCWMPIAVFACIRDDCETRRNRL
jgi:hypothetical protein